MFLYPQTNAKPPEELQSPPIENFLATVLDKPRIVLSKYVAELTQP